MADLVTLEAIVEEDGAVRLLSKVRFPKRRRALLTILDEEPTSHADVREPAGEQIDDVSVLGLWSGHEGTHVELAEKIRRANRRTT